MITKGCYIFCCSNYSVGEYSRSTVSGAIPAGRCPHSEVHGPSRRRDHYSANCTTGETIVSEVISS